MADEHVRVRAIVREELAKVSPKPNDSTLYQHVQSLIRNAAHNSLRELQISQVNPRINTSSSSTPTVERKKKEHKQQWQSKL